MVVVIDLRITEESAIVLGGSLKDSKKKKGLLHSQTLKSEINMHSCLASFVAHWRSVDNSQAIFSFRSCLTEIQLPCRCTVFIKLKCRSWTCRCSCRTSFIIIQWVPYLRKCPREAFLFVFLLIIQNCFIPSYTGLCPFFGILIAKRILLNFLCMDLKTSLKPHLLYLALFICQVHLSKVFCLIY